MIFMATSLPLFLCLPAASTVVVIAGLHEKDLIVPHCGHVPGLGGSCGHVTDLHRRSQTVRSPGRRQQRSDTLS